MQLWRNAFLVKTTLFFFAVMLLLNPVYAQQWPLVNLDPANVGSTISPEQNELPVMVVSEEESQQLIREFETRGYVVQAGTLAQLDEVVEAANQKATVAAAGNDHDTKKECEKVSAENESQDGAVGQDGEKSTTKAVSVKASGTQKVEDSKCESEKTTADVSPQNSQDDDSIDLPAPTPAPVPEPYPEADVHTSVGLQVNMSGGSSGGSHHDFAKVFFIFAGIAVVAAFVVYAGKYISDIANGKKMKMWRELVFNSTFLSTKPGRYGQFIGARLATGFVSDELIQLALVGELGNANLKLILNENSDSTPLDLSATYWMLGASARLHLSDKLVNASYLYLEFMGGSTSNGATDLIGAARLGASFGLNDYWRLGASLGAQYIGLNKGQGFNNDGENYWVTYGVEVGAQF